MLPDILNSQCTSLGTLWMVTGSLLESQRDTLAQERGLTDDENFLKSESLYTFEPAHGLASCTVIDPSLSSTQASNCRIAPA